MTQVQAQGIADRLRNDKIPADVLWLDIDYQDRNRPFTVDKKAYPDLPGLVSKLDAMKMKLVVITDLHIASAPNQGYAPYDSGMKLDGTMAIAALNELRREGYKPKRTIIIEFSGDEETRMKTSAIIAEKLKHGPIQGRVGHLPDERRAQRIARFHRAARQGKGRAPHLRHHHLADARLYGPGVHRREGVRLVEKADRRDEAADLGRRQLGAAGDAHRQPVLPAIRAQAA